jgi:paired amphipathic helix protein Sin3a
MFEAAAASPLIGMQDLIRYRREAELHVGADDHLYRIQWVCAQPAGSLVPVSNLLSLE